MKPGYAPQCPNHRCALEGLPFPLPTKGIGKCPISGADFEFEADVDESKVITDKFGNITKAVGWRISGGEGASS